MSEGPPTLYAVSHIDFQNASRPDSTELLPRLIPLRRLRPPRPTRAQGHGVDMPRRFFGGDADLLLLHREWDERHGADYLFIGRVSFS